MDPLFLDVLVLNGAPYQLVKEYVLRISDIEERFQTCLKNQLFELAIDACIELKDSAKINSLVEKIVAKYGDNSVSRDLVQKVEKALKTNHDWKIESRRI